jgi:hypothetical protein
LRLKQPTLSRAKTWQVLARLADIRQALLRGLARLADIHQAMLRGLARLADQCEKNVTRLNTFARVICHFCKFGASGHCLGLAQNNPIKPCKYWKFNLVMLSTKGKTIYFVTKTKFLKCRTKIFQFIIPIF